MKPLQESNTRAPSSAPCSRPPAPARFEMGDGRVKCLFRLWHRICALYHSLENHAACRRGDLSASLTHAERELKHITKLGVILAMASCSHVPPPPTKVFQRGAEIGQRVIIHYPYCGDETGKVTGTHINGNGDTIWEVTLPDGTIEPIWSFDGWGTTLLPNVKTVATEGAGKSPTEATQPSS